MACQHEIRRRREHVEAQRLAATCGHARPRVWMHGRLRVNARSTPYPPRGGHCADFGCQPIDGVGVEAVLYPLRAVDERRAADGEAHPQTGQRSATWKASAPPAGCRSALTSGITGFARRNPHRPRPQRRPCRSCRPRCVRRRRALQRAAGGRIGVRGKMMAPAWPWRAGR